MKVILIRRYCLHRHVRRRIGSERLPRKKIPWPDADCRAAGGLVQIIPGILTDVIGLTSVGAVVAFQYFRIRLRVVPFRRSRILKCKARLPGGQKLPIREFLSGAKWPLKWRVTFTGLLVYY
jgi:hypothetical protein